jgi:nitrate reductase gamma subunit
MDQGLDLLGFARGPALQWSLLILVFGVAWRLAGVLLLRAKVDLSEPRSAASVAGGLRMIWARMWPKPEFMRASIIDLALGYAFHVGLFIVIFFGLPHILFIKSATGLSWPNLPNGAVFFVGAVALAALVALLVHRLATPVKRLLSNFDDYFSWFVTAAPLATGLLAAAHVGARYETLLALHILSVELLFVWLPFGKLMHTFWAFISRGTTGAAFARKGAGI